MCCGDAVVVLESHYLVVIDDRQSVTGLLASTLPDIRYEH